MSTFRVQPLVNQGLRPVAAALLCAPGLAIDHVGDSARARGAAPGAAGKARRGRRLHHSKYDLPLWIVRYLNLRVVQWRAPRRSTMRGALREGFGY